MLESSQIQVMIALTEAQSLSQAGEILNITQSAVSQNIKAIESKLGLSLISRQGKNMILTPEGLKIAKLSKSFEKSFSDLVSQIHEDKNKLVGDVNLGTMFGIGKSWICSRVVEFSLLYPNINITIKLGFPEELKRLFENRELDYLVLPEGPDLPYSEKLELQQEKATLVYPADKQFNISSDSGLKDILSYPLIFFEKRDPLFYSWCKEKFGKAPRNITPRVVVNSFNQMLQAVHENIGIAVIPTHVLRRSYLKDKIRNLDSNFEIKSNKFNFIYHSEHQSSLKVQTLYKFLLEEASSQVL